MKFKSGDIVRLKTGGPTMVVGNVTGNQAMGYEADVFYVTPYEVRAISLPECVLVHCETKDS